MPMKVKVAGALNYASRAAVQRAASYRGPQPKTEVFSMCLIKYANGAATIIPIPRSTAVFQAAPPIYPRSAFGYAGYEYAGDSFSGLEVSYTRAPDPPIPSSIVLDVVSLPPLTDQWFYVPDIPAYSPWIPFYTSGILKVHQVTMRTFPDSIPELLVVLMPWTLIYVGSGNQRTVNSPITADAYFLPVTTLLDALDAYPAESDSASDSWFNAVFAPAHSGPVTKAMYHLGANPGDSEFYIGTTLVASDSAVLRAAAAGLARWNVFAGILLSRGALIVMRYTPPYSGEAFAVIDYDTLTIVEDTATKIADYTAAIDAEYASYLADPARITETTDVLSTGAFPAWWDDSGFTPYTNAPFSALAGTEDFTDFEVTMFGPTGGGPTGGGLHGADTSGTTTVYGKAVFTYGGSAVFIRWELPTASEVAVPAGGFNMMTRFSGLQYPDTGGFTPQDALTRGLIAAFTTAP